MKAMQQAQLAAAQRAVTEHRAAAERILTAVEASGRKELSAAEQAAFDRHEYSMRTAQERVELLKSHRRDDAAPQSAAALRADLEAARQRVEGTSTARPSAHRRRAAAFHEAGHAVAFLARGARVLRVSLNGNGGLCEAEPSVDPVACMAGAAAEAHAGFWDCQPSASDLAGARAGFRESGRTDAWLPGAMQQALELVAAHWPAVKAVAAQLERCGSLSGDAVARIAGDAMRRARAARHNRGQAYSTPVGLPIASVG